MTKLHEEQQPNMEAQHIPWATEVLAMNTRLKFYHYWMNTTGFIYIKWPGPWIFQNTQLIVNFTGPLSTWKGRSSAIIWLGLEQ